MGIVDVAGAKKADESGVTLSVVRSGGLDAQYSRLVLIESPDDARHVANARRLIEDQQRLFGLATQPNSLVDATRRGRLLEHLSDEALQRRLREGAIEMWKMARVPPYVADDSVEAAERRRSLCGQLCDGSCADPACAGGEPTDLNTPPDLSQRRLGAHERRRARADGRRPHLYPAEYPPVASDWVPDRQPRIARAAPQSAAQLQRPSHRDPRLTFRRVCSFEVGGCHYVRRTIQPSGAPAGFSSAIARTTRFRRSRSDRSIKEECLDQIVPIGSAALPARRGGVRRTITENGITKVSTIG